MSFKGMDPQAGMDLADRLKEGGQAATDYGDTLTQTITGINWVGPDQESFIQAVSAFTQNQIAAVYDKFNVKGDELRVDAEEQDRTSNDTGL